MPAEKLYDLAIQYKKTKLWKQLSDTELFALELSNGKTGYCCVMGEMGEHIALALFVGRDGLDSYRLLFEAGEAANEMAEREKMMAQDCVQCSFENKDELAPFEVAEARRYAKARGLAYRGPNSYPMFRRYRPARYPWFLQDETDEQFLYEALSAALEVAGRLGTAGKRDLGFQDGAPFDREIPFLERSGGGYRLSTVQLPAEQEKTYPSPRVADELLAARLKKKKKTGHVWTCEVVMVPEPMSDEVADEDGLVEAPENAPFFPFMLLVADCESEIIIPIRPVADYERDAGELVADLARVMEEHGVPSALEVRDERTKMLLGGFAGQIGAKVILTDELPLLDEIEKDMFDQFRSDQAGSEEDMESSFQLLMQMDDETLRSMPGELRAQILELDAQGILPEPVSLRVRRLFK